jgi:hypothetical protein
MNDKEKINRNLLDDLKNLPKVDAPKYFETDLWRKINQQEQNIEESFWAKLFTPQRYVPATVVLAFLVLIIFIVDKSRMPNEPSFSYEPNLKTEFVIYIPQSTELKSSGLRRKIVDKENIPAESTTEDKQNADMFDDRKDAASAPVLESRLENASIANENNVLSKSKLENIKGDSLAAKNKTNFRGGTASSQQNFQNQLQEGVKQNDSTVDKKADVDQQKQNNQANEAQKPR